MYIEKSENYDEICKIVSNSPAIVNAPKVKSEKMTHFVAKDGEKIVGNVTVWQRAFFLSVIKYLVVKENYRERGIGKKLVNKATEFSKNELKTPVNIATITLNNIPSIKVLSKNNFRPVDIVKSPISNRKLWIMIQS